MALAPTPLKPYIWLKFINTNESELHFNVNGLPAGKMLSTPTAGYIDDNSTSRTRIVTYNIINGTATDEIVHYLDASTSYNPTLEYITILIKQGGTLKGKGSVCQSEADANGGGTDEL